MSSSPVNNRGLFEPIKINPKKNGYKIFDVVGLDRLNTEDIIKIYNKVRSEEKNPELKLFTFEVRDYLLRRLAQNPSEISSLTFPEELQKDVSRLDQNKGAFYSITDLANGAITDTRESGKTEQPRSLQVTIEYDKAMIGGVGSVVKSLSYQMKERGVDGRVVTPFYDLYKKDIAQNNLKFVGFITHEYEGRTLTSSIYKTMSQGGKVPQYLVQCDPTMRHLFDVGTASEVYSAYNADLGYGCNERSLYLASVVAVMGSTYRGRKKQKQFDIVSFHTWTATLAAHLMKDKFEPLREKAGLGKVYTMQHFHHGSLELAHDRFDATAYATLGIQTPYPIRHISLQEDFLLHTDGVGFVSPVLPNEAQNPETGYGLHEAAQHKANNGRLGFLPNGMVWNDHGLSSVKAHGKYAVPETTTDVVAAKGAIKADLFKAGIVADPKRPLFMYVGRYSPEKGIDKLKAMVKAAIDEGGQCVIMGWGDSKEVPQEIQDLQKLPRKYQKYLKVYTQPIDQTAVFGDSGASKGSLIRAAADAQFLPSRFEGYAMVVIEALARGIVLVSSDGGGLKVQCVDQTEGDGFNGFKYSNQGDAESNAAHATKRAMHYFKQTDPNDRNTHAKRLIEDSKRFDWLATQGPLDKIQAFYKQIMKPRTDAETSEREKLIQDYYQKFKVGKCELPPEFKKKIVQCKMKLTDTIRFAWQKVCLFFLNIFERVKSIPQAIYTTFERNRARMSLKPWWFCQNTA